MGAVQLVVFSLGKEEYAIDINYAQEIIRIPQHMINMPNTPLYIEGMINLRDRVIPVVDLKKSFGYACAEKGEDSRLLILNLQSMLVGFIVDDVSEVMKLEEKDIEKLVPEIAMAGSRCLHGIGRTGTRLIMLLDAIKLKNELFKNNIEME